jgi:methyl-accepting chemotaxis protein
LNAAVEAARAGEMGRSFAMVADEIRKLAESIHNNAALVQESVGNIQSTIENILTATKNLGFIETGYSEIYKVLELLLSHIQEELAVADGILQKLNELANISTANSQEIEKLSEEYSELIREIEGVEVQLKKFRF